MQENSFGSEQTQNNLFLLLFKVELSFSHSGGAKIRSDA